MRISSKPNTWTKMRSTISFTPQGSTRSKEHVFYLLFNPRSITQLQHCHSRWLVRRLVPQQHIVPKLGGRLEPIAATTTDQMVALLVPSLSNGQIPIRYSNVECVMLSVTRAQPRTVEHVMPRSARAQPRTIFPSVRLFPGFVKFDSYNSRDSLNFVRT